MQIPISAIIHGKMRQVFNRELNLEDLNLTNLQNRLHFRNFPFWQKKKRDSRKFPAKCGTSSNNQKNWRICITQQLATLQLTTGRRHNISTKCWQKLP